MSSYVTPIDSTVNDLSAIMYFSVNGKQCTEIIASDVLIFLISLQHNSFLSFIAFSWINNQ